MIFLSESSDKSKTIAFKSQIQEDLIVIFWDAFTKTMRQTERK